MMTSTHVPRWMKVTLAISLAFNMLLGGLIVGRLLLSPFNPFSAKPGINIAGLVDHLTDGMMESDQRVVRTAMHQHQAALTDKLSAVGTAKARVIDLTLADKVYSEDLQKAFDQVGIAAEAMRTELAQIMVEVMPNLSFEGRQKVIKMIEGQTGRRGPPWRR